MFLPRVQETSRGLWRTRPSASRASAKKPPGLQAVEHFDGGRDQLSHARSPDPFSPPAIVVSRAPDRREAASPIPALGPPTQARGSAWRAAPGQGLTSHPRDLLGPRGNAEPKKAHEVPDARETEGWECGRCSRHGIRESPAPSRPARNPYISPIPSLSAMNPPCQVWFQTWPENALTLSMPRIMPFFLTSRV